MTVREIARAAEIAEQTLYNYFPTKEQLVTDDEQQIEQQMCDLIRRRPAGTSPAAAVREFVLSVVSGIRRTPPELAGGDLGSLAAISPAVHRLVLQMLDRQASALAAVIGETGPVRPEIARLQGIALAGVFQMIISESGRRARAGQTPAQISDALHPEIGNVLAELDRWLTR